MNTTIENFDEDFIKDLNLNSMLIDEDQNLNETYRIHFEVREQIIFGIQWLLFQVIGNGLLIGLIQFDRFGGNPLKRRITDQVSRFFCNILRTI